MDNSQISVVAIVGPTGSGKTALALALAKKFNGVLVSADSRQVYQGLDIGTNKEGMPHQWQGETSRQIDGIDQLMIDIAKPGERFTLADWLKEADRVISKIHQNKKLPIVVGGTGLYVTALLDGWALRDDDLSQRANFEAMSLDNLQKLAHQKNLNTSDFNNKRRLIRALESTPTPDSALKRPNHYRALVLQPVITREVLFQKSNERCQNIFESLCQEIVSLQKQGVSQEWLENIGLDYRWATSTVTGQTDPKTALERLQGASRAYIRRQETWWRHHGLVTGINTCDEAVIAIDQFLIAE